MVAFDESNELSGGEFMTPVQQLLDGVLVHLGHIGNKSRDGQNADGCT
jgi:hypothetical protein